METNDNETVCYCDHLTDFGGGGPLPAVNDIDFAAAFAGFADIGDNPVVFAVSMVLIALFFILMMWARRKDKILDLKVFKQNIPSLSSFSTSFHDFRKSLCLHLSSV